MRSLATGRTSVWTAINTWPALNPNGRSVFARQYKFTHDSPQGEEPGPKTGADCPAIMIVPSQTTPAWINHLTQEWPYILEVKLWTGRHVLQPMEDLVEDVVDAIYKAVAEGQTVPITKVATGYHPQRLGPITIQPAMINDGKVKIMAASIFFGLKILKAQNPQ